MVNDQLIRVYQLKQLLAYEKMSSKLDQASFGEKPNDLSTQFNRIKVEDKRDSYDQHQISPTDNLIVESQRQVQSQHTPGSLVKTKTSPSLKERVLLRKQNSSSSGNSNHSSKRRSSWRNLINPNYKSRSDEFHKIFCDKIPPTERLIADYACALHREILIQGRVYISVNYVAFYSNLFGWITKLVVRLRDISEIFKANTARIIPNAIQIITTSGEKHVLASLVARDKTYVMLLRIWQNNQMRNDRMTDQEIRNLVHYGYGKDLGMSDNEELKINSPDPVTPANVPLDSGNKTSMADRINISNLAQNSILAGNNRSEEVDKNNNSLSSRHSISLGEPRSPEAGVNHQQVSNCDNTLINPETNHTRYNSVDLNGAILDVDQDNIINEVASKLNELTGSDHTKNLENELLTNTYSPAPSSAVILDTPPGPNCVAQKSDRNLEGCFETNGSCISRIENETNSLDVEEQNRYSLGASSTETRVAADFEIGNHRDDHGGDNYGLYEIRHSDGEDPIDLVTDCGCGEHGGQLIADQEFDINIDTLFTLIFTNSKFMRTYMVRRGMTDAIVSGWKRSNNGTDKSNTSTLYDRPNRKADNVPSSMTPKTIHTKQIRQLNYSMSIDHLWAKQVQVEERQNICQVLPGVYVLKSETINSGIPYGETFTVDTSYCLTRNGNINRSKMLVHSFVNFNKEKQNWRLSMVKSIIERESMQGVKDFIDDLTSCIKEYINKTIEQRNDEVGGEQAKDMSSTENGARSPKHNPEVGRKGLVPQSGGGGGRYHYKCTNSLTRAKSKLKERKLRNMYSYYIGNADEDDVEGGAFNCRFGDEEDSDEDYDELDDDEDRRERHRNKRREGRRRRRRQHLYWGDLSDDIGTSFSSFSDSDLDENGSMMMMMRTTDDQVSDAASLSLRGVADGAVWGQMDGRSGFRVEERSFSDVDESARFCATNRRSAGFADDGHATRTNSNQGQNERQQRRSGRSANPHRPHRQPQLQPEQQQQQHDTDNRRTRSLSQKRRLLRAGIVAAAASNAGSGSLHASTNVVYGRQQNGQWSPFTITASLRRPWAALGVKTLAGFLFVTLLITLFSMIVSHVMILRRLESLEARLAQMKCDQPEEPILNDLGGGNNKW